MTTNSDFNLRDSDGSLSAARVRGSTQRPDFRADAEPLDPAAVGAEAHARAQGAAERRQRAIDQGGQESSAGAAPSLLLRLEALARRVQSLEADAIVMRARLNELEARKPKPATVSALRRPDADPPEAA